MFGTFWNQIMKKKKKNINSIYFDRDSDYKDNETRFSYKM